MKKKLVFSLLVVFILVSICVTSFADNLSNDFEAVVDCKDAKTGENVVIDVSFKNNTGLIAAIFELTYDKTRLELVRTEDRGILEGAVFSQNYDVYPYIMVWNSASTENYTANGTFVTLTFKVKDNAEPGKAFINLNYDSDNVFDVNLDNVNVKVLPGEINVQKSKESSERKSGSSSSGGGRTVSPESEKNNTESDVIDDSLNQIIFTIDKKEAVVFGETKINDVAPIIRNDRTMLPARFVAENLGAKVEWTETGTDQGVVTITKDDIKIVITINSDTAYVNDTLVKLDSPAFIENDRTYTPLRFIAENLGAKVKWKEETQQVIITK